MRKIEDLQPALWLAESPRELAAPFPRKAWLAETEPVYWCWQPPDLFESYALVLHPLLSIPLQRHVRWSELASRHPDSDGFSHQSFPPRGPDEWRPTECEEGVLVPAQWLALRESIRAAAPAEPVFYFYSLFNFGPSLYRGSLADLDEILGEESGYPWPSPSHTWPESRRWCVYTDVDLFTTVVCGSARLIANVLASSTLEAIPTKYADLGLPHDASEFEPAV